MLYTLLLSLHSLFRWLVLISLLYAIYCGAKGWSGKVAFSKTDNTIRHLTATIAHIQLAIGYTLYFYSPLITYFRENYRQASKQFELLFFGVIHVLLMTTAIVIITIGSAMAKRKERDTLKFRTMAVFYIIALFIIFISIPWPFSPFANRPYLRPF